MSCPVIKGKTGVEAAQWGPKGDWLAIRAAETLDKAALTLYSPNDTRDSTFPLFPLLSAQVDPRRALKWSPDGQHIAVSILPDQDSLTSPWSLDVFGIDGTAFRGMTNKLTAGIESEGHVPTEPLMWWLPDSKTLLYVATTSNFTLGNLMAFQPDQPQPFVVQLNIILNPDRSQDGPFRIFEVQQNDRCQK